MNKLLTIFLIFLFVNNLQSQEKGFINYSVDDDLQSSTIYYAMQDSKGYLWFSTDNGVSKFNGYEFKNYTTSDGLITNTVFNIYEDYKGRIWFLSFNGNLCYYFNNKFIEYKYNSILSYEKNGLLTPPRNGFYIDTLDNVYISFNEKNNFLKIDSTGKYTKIASQEETISIIAIDSITTINTIKNVFNKVLIKINDTEKVFNLPYTNKIFAVSNSGVRNNEIVFNTDKYVYLVKNGKLKILYKNDNTIYFVKYSGNNIWVGTNKGVVLLNRNSEGIITKIDTLLSQYKVSAVVEDNEGGSWFTTLNNGVFYKPKSDIKQYYAELLKEDITDICFINKEVYISTYSNRFYIIKNNKIVKKELPKDVFIINSISPYKDSSIIITTANKLFFYKNGEIRIEKNVNSVKNTLLVNNKLFIGSRFGFYLVDDSLKSIRLFDDWVNSSFELNDSTIIVAGKHGAYIVNSIDNTYQEIILRTKQEIVTINKYKDYILFGTKDGGVVFYNNKTMEIINDKNGLSSNFIRDIKVYNKYIWVATNKGLNLINLESSTIESPFIQSFYATNGLISNTVNVLNIKDSILYIGTNKGISYLNLNSFLPRKYIPNIQISSIKINKRDTTILHKYKLNYKENNLIIDYIGISYSFQKRIKYKYRFQKINEPEQWIYTNNSSINLVELNSDTYIFEVYSVINNIESKHSIKILFQIKPPFWDNIIFRIIFIFIIISISILILYFLNKRNKQKNIGKLNIYKYQNQALINQINPHFIFNTLNSIQLYIYKNEKLKSAEYITKFSKLMRQVLDYSKIELITVAEEIEVIKSYVELERLRFDNKFDFKFNVDNKLLYKKILPLITQPYIENAIWHGLMLKETKGLLEIFIYEHENNIIIAIDDDGIGRKKAKEINSSKTFKKTSYGQSIGVERINVFNKVYKKNAELEVRDIITHGEITGTRVLIKFPKLT